ncbi:MAG: uroporphyrinogen-III C-methyltransferase [Phycisphaeraceae bacterium]
MTNQPKNHAGHAPQGHVCLIGAGPGDPGLITVRGLERLRAARVVVFDALSAPALLEQAAPDAELIDVGKRAKAHKLTQDQTNDLLVQKAREGGLVVRLKGGDPYLFGRGAEEATYLARHGITCEVIPGVTSGIAAPAMAGIPVTHRGHASTVTFVTGHEDPGKSDTAIDFAALAAMVAAGGTLCFYMGVGRLTAIVQSLSSHGLPMTTPIALVQWGTTARQRSLRSTFAQVSREVERTGIGSPAIIVVGAVAGIDDPGLTWFTDRPLFGQRILVTRTRQQASELRAQLEALGAAVLEAPTIEIASPTQEDTRQVADAVASISQYDWLVLTSGNAVAALAEALAKQDRDARHLAGVKIAAVGEATAEALRDRLNVRPDLVPTRAVAESLAGELIAQQDLAGKRVLLLRADIARPNLPKLLTDAGATVEEVTVYRTQRPASLPDAVLDALRDKQIDWVTFTSSSTARNLVEMLGQERTLLEPLQRASIGPITSQTLRELNLPPTIESQEANVAGLVAVLVQACAAQH